MRACVADSQRERAWPALALSGVNCCCCCARARALKAQPLRRWWWLGLPYALGWCGFAIKRERERVCVCVCRVQNIMSVLSCVGTVGRHPRKKKRPLLAVWEDGGVYSPSPSSRAVRLPPTRRVVFVLGPVCL